MIQANDELYMRIVFVWEFSNYEKLAMYTSVSIIREIYLRSKEPYSVTVSDVSVVKGKIDNKTNESIKNQWWSMPMDVINDYYAVNKKFWKGEASNHGSGAREMLDFC